jgi:alanine dehydrogenase
MQVGVPTEIKTDEARVALTPPGARELTAAGHEVIIQAGAGRGSNIADEDYVAQGARIVPDAESVFDEAELIIKVKEPQQNEIAMLRPHHTLFGYLHLAPDPEQAHGLIESGATCVAFETVEDTAGKLPLLAPMSAVAGRIAAQAGAFMLQRASGGGLLMGGIPGVRRARVAVLGGGVVGFHAATIAMGMQADVTVFDRSGPRLDWLDETTGGRLRTGFSSPLAIEQELERADLVIGAVLLPGARAPKLITREMLALLPGHAVLVDVAIDQGGCFETSHPTTHSEPTFELDGIRHYCVANMPGAVPVTSTWALANATLPYIVAIAGLGLAEAIRNDPGLRAGLNIADGHVTHPAVAEALRLPWQPAGNALVAATA